MKISVEENQRENSYSKSKSPQMFNRISEKYDVLNHLLSLGLDIVWRNTAVRHFKDLPNQTVLDLATGTADLILAAFKKNPNIVSGIGIDPAKKMLEIGKKKVIRRIFTDQIKLLQGDGNQLPFAEGSFHGAMIAFGIRNIPNFQTSLREIYRILKKEGRLVVLEFSIPTNSMIRKFYLFYFRKILPQIGGFFSGDKTSYQYLNKSVENFYYGEQFCEKLREIGFQSITMIPLTFGIATIYTGDKP